MQKKSFIIAAYIAFVQYYNYHLFGFLAVKIALYFFGHDNLLQLQSTYLIMALAMIAKPIGAVILGKIGDTYGRSGVFNISLVGIAIASLIIGFLPQYNDIGMIAIIILVIARIITCALVSSGSDGIRIYIYEHLNSNKQCLGISLTNIFTQAGSLIASVTAWFFTIDFMPSYAWRIAFMLGGIIALIAIVLVNRFKITDTIELKQNQNFDKFKDLSLKLILKEHSALFIFCTLIAGCIGSTNQFFVVFFGTYNFSVLKNIDQSTMQIYTSFAISIYMIFSIISGIVADRVGCLKVAAVASLILVIIGIGHIYNLHNNHFNIYLFFTTTATLPFLTMPAAVILKKSIPVVIRYRIFSLAHAVGSIAISAPTAFVATYFYNKTHIPWLPVIYFILTIIVTILALNRISNMTADN